MTTRHPRGSARSARSIRFALPAVILALAASACAPAQTSPFAPRPTADPETLLLTVENENFVDVRVQVVAGAGRHPLGFVASGRSRRFRVSRALLGGGSAIRLAADPTGRADLFLSETIEVGHDGELVWTLAPNLRLSSWMIR